jgi:GTPase SAR1 family protein
MYCTCLIVLLVCRMTLLLGPPGSGKSTLLRALSGKLDAQLKVLVYLCLNFLLLSWYSLIESICIQLLNGFNFIRHDCRIYKMNLFLF